MKHARASRTIGAALLVLLAASAGAGDASATPPASRAPVPAAPTAVPAPAAPLPRGVRVETRATPAPPSAQAPRAAPRLWPGREEPKPAAPRSTEPKAPGPLLPQHAPGTFLGKGSFKKVYLAKGAPDAVVRVMQPEEDGMVNVAGDWVDAGELLAKEHRLLHTLEQHGFPVVRVLAKGDVHGLPADVLERFEFSDRDKDRFARDGRTVLRTALPDLRRMRRALETSGVAILDIQILLKPGHVVIADPMDVVPRAENPGAYAANLKFVDELLALAGADAAN